MARMDSGKGRRWIFGAGAVLLCLALLGAIDARETLPGPVPARVGCKPKRPPVEIGGPKGLDPTRYGDWERKGRCIDF